MITKGRLIRKDTMHHIPIYHPEKKKAVFWGRVQVIVMIGFAAYIIFSIVFN